MSAVTADLLEKLDPEHRELLYGAGRLATERGEHAYLVGGSVRDLVLQREHDDLDIVVEGDGLAVAQGLSRSVDGELTRHHAFHTATVMTPRGLRVDVATARKEEYPRPGYLPQVVAGTLDDDLVRRDFTINTMAISLAAGDWGRFIDPLDGLADLEAGRVRVMHSRSFADDPTRVLRALRFALRFGYDIEEETHAWLREAVVGGYLDGVSGDRVRKEVRLAFGERPIDGPLRLQADGVLQNIHPGLNADAARLGRLQETLAWYQGTDNDALTADDTDTWDLVLGCCAAGLPPQARWELVRRLRLSREQRAPLVQGGVPWRKAMNAIEAAGDAIAESDIERALRGLCTGGLLVAASLDEPGGKLERAVRRYLEKLRGVRPELSGADLQTMGVAQGPLVGEFLEKLRAARLDGSAVSAAEERRLVLAWLAEEPRRQGI